MKDETQVKDEIILVVKEAIRENTTLAAVDWEVAELYSDDVDNIAEEIADKLCPLVAEAEKDKEIARLTAENERLSKQLTDGKCVYLSDSETAEGCVQSPCPNYKTVEDILKENASLHARLEKAVALPFSHLETLKLLTCAAMCYAKIRELITERMASSNDIKDLFMHVPLIQGTTLNFALNCLDKSNLNCNKIKGFEEVLNAMGDFKDYLAKAEARLAELKGGEGE